MRGGAHRIGLDSTIQIIHSLRAVLTERRRIRACSSLFSTCRLSERVKEPAHLASAIRRQYVANNMAATTKNSVWMHFGSRLLQHVRLHRGVDRPTKIMSSLKQTMRLLQLVALLACRGRVSYRWSTPFRVTVF